MRTVKLTHKVPRHYDHHLWEDIVRQLQGPLNDLGAFFVTPQQFGAEGLGVNDDTTAVQAAIDAVKGVGGVVFFPTGTYLISRLDLTGISNRGVHLIGRGWDNTKFFPKSGTASYGTETGHLFDCTGSVGLVFKDFMVGAFNQTPEPTTCFFLAQVASGVSNAFHFDGVYVTGKYTTAAFYNYGVPSSTMVNCDWYNYKTGAGNIPVAAFTADNAFGLESDFETVDTGQESTSDWTMVGCEFHKFGGASANNDVIYLQDTADLRWLGGNITGGAAGYVAIVDTCKHTSFYGTTFETESEPVTPTNVFDISGTAEGLTWDQCEYITGTAIVGGAGALLGGSGNIEYLFHSLPDTGIAAGATVYVGPAGHDATEGNAYVPVTHKGVFNHFRVITSASPGVGQTYTVTLRINGGDTSVTATVSGTGTTASDLAHYAHVNPGDLISVKVVSSAGANVTRLGAAIGLMRART